MASEKQINSWMNQAAKINDDPEYINAFVEYKQQAKKADQRLVRLEALNHDNFYEGVLQFSYKKALEDVKSWGGDKRFNTAPPTTLTELEMKISDINDFLRKPSSMQSKIDKIYVKGTNTINKKYAKQFGVDFTWQDIATYYTSKTAEKNDKRFGSKTLVRALAVLKRISQDDLQNIKDVNQRIELVSSKKAVNRIAKKLAAEGYSYENLMK